MSDSAVSAGITVIPEPVADADSDLWMLHQWYAGSFTFSSAIGIQTELPFITVDSKAMRKVNNDQDLVLVLEGGSAGEGSNIQLMGRILIKMH